jgi:hypothetical protein
VNTEVGICNLALAHIGEAPTLSSINPPEGSQAAEHCARFYPYARDAVLRVHAWKFATTHRTLAPLAGAPLAWHYKYALPVDCVRALAVYAPGQGTRQTFDLALDPGSGQEVVLADQDAAVLEYIARVTDPNRYDALFVLALSWLLASHLAMPVARNPRIQAACNEQYLRVLSQATAVSANEARTPATTSPSWIANR